MQEQLLKEVEERMRASLKALDAETVLKTWLPAGLKGFEQLQEMFLQPDGRPGAPGRSSGAGRVAHSAPAARANGARRIWSRSPRHVG